MPDEATADETSPAPAPTTSPAPAARGAEAAEGDGRQNNRKVREGVVISDRMDKTAVVTITSRVRHPRYNKTLQRHKKLYVDDPGNDLHVGDRVRVQETRPTSKLKRWRVVNVLERAR
ncbi:MAG: 30S ribosomal protein S17 [Acidimicrobiia bacterium]|nr:30S ribosomal protein S17 [Acidimicrobiia bacterium]